MPSLQQRSPLTKCKKNTLCTLFPPRSHIHYATEILYLTLCQDIMVALLDNKLLDYRIIFPFLFIVDVALYLLLGKNYFQRQITTEPLLVPQDFALFDRFPSHDIWPINKQRQRFCVLPTPTIMFLCTKDCYHVHNLFLTLFHGTKFFWGDPWHDIFSFFMSFFYVFSLFYYFDSHFFIFVHFFGEFFWSLRPVYFS